MCLGFQELTSFGLGAQGWGFSVEVMQPIPYTNVSENNATYSLTKRACGERQ